MLRTAFLTFSLALLGFVTPPPSQAALLPAYYPAAGYYGDFVVKDDQTGLEWRRFGDTDGLSSTQVDRLVMTAVDWAGWRFATTNEVLALLQGNLSTHSHIEIAQTFSHFFELFSYTFTLGDGQGGQNLYIYARLSRGGSDIQVVRNAYDII